MVSSPSLSGVRWTTCDVEEFLKMDDEVFARCLTSYEHDMLK